MVISKRNFIILTQESAYPQMGPLYLADALSRVGIQTHLLPVKSGTKALDDLISRTDPIAAGMSVMTSPDLVEFVEASMHIQETYNNANRNGHDNKRPPLPVLWGGMHATILQEQTAQEPYINYVFSGESEASLPLFLLRMVGDPRAKHLTDDDIFLPGSSEKLKLVRTPLTLDDYQPDWSRVHLPDLLFPEEHSVHSKKALERGATKHDIFYYMLTSRGCTYKCDFCWEIARTAALQEEQRILGTGDDYTWRAHSLSWIERQLDMLHERLGANGRTFDGIGVWDDMPFGKNQAHRERARALFSMMRDRDFGYLLEVRANQLIKTSGFWHGGSEREADLYKFLKETGCLQVFVGAESASQETLNTIIKKGTKVADYRRLVEISQDVRLPIRYSIIVGFPGETDASVNETLDFVDEMREEPFISISGPKLATPYPRTGLYWRAMARGLKEPKTTVEWARINRYTNYQDLFPWLREDLRPQTLERIDSYFNQIDSERKRQANVNRIYELVRAH